MADTRMTQSVTEELNKGVAHDAITGLALAATAAASITAHEERKMAREANRAPVAIEVPASEHMVVQEDPTRPVVAAAKAQSLKAKLADIRGKIKPTVNEGEQKHSKDGDTLHENCLDSREDLAKECKSCGFLHKSVERCWKGANGKSLKQLQKTEGK